MANPGKLLRGDCVCAPLARRHTYVFHFSESGRGKVLHSRPQKMYSTITSVVTHSCAAYNALSIHQDQSARVHILQKKPPFIDVGPHLPPRRFFK